MIEKTTVFETRRNNERYGLYPTEHAARLAVGNTGEIRPVLLSAIFLVMIEDGDFVHAVCETLDAAVRRKAMYDFNRRKSAEPATIVVFEVEV